MKKSNYQFKMSVPQVYVTTLEAILKQHGVITSRSKRDSTKCRSFHFVVYRQRALHSCSFSYLASSLFHSFPFSLFFSFALILSFHFSLSLSLALICIISSLSLEKSDLIHIYTNSLRGKTMLYRLNTNLWLYPVLESQIALPHMLIASFVVICIFWYYVLFGLVLTFYFMPIVVVVVAVVCPFDLKIETDSSNIIVSLYCISVLCV